MAAAPIDLATAHRPPHPRPRRLWRPPGRGGGAGPHRPRRLARDRQLALPAAEPAAEARIDALLIPIRYAAGPGEQITDERRPPLLFF